MSKLTREDVLKLARLSRLHLSDEDLDHFTAEISAILGYVEQLQEVNLTGTEPTYQVTGLKNVTRPDEIRTYGPTSPELLKNAPSIEGTQFKVKRMIG